MWISAAVPSQYGLKPAKWSDRVAVSGAAERSWLALTKDMSPLMIHHYCS